MDGDGDQYLVSGSQNSGGVQWFENSGSRKPTFEARSIDGNSGNRVADITVADMDADGDLDVITAINTRQILWYENDGAESPGFSPHESAARGRTVFAADIDGDRRQDLLSIENNTIAWFPTTQRLVRHQENTVQVLISETATDADGGTLTYAIAGGADKLLFGIDSTTAEPEFLSAPVFSSPADMNRDNIYTVIISVTDGFSTLNRSISVEVFRP